MLEIRSIASSDIPNPETTATKRWSMLETMSIVSLDIPNPETAACSERSRCPISKRKRGATSKYPDIVHVSVRFAKPSFHLGRDPRTKPATIALFDIFCRLVDCLERIRSAAPKLDGSYPEIMEGGSETDHLRHTEALPQSHPAVRKNEELPPTS